MADLVVLTGDIFKTSSAELLGLNVDLTMVDGEIVYRENQSFAE